MTKTPMSLFALARSFDTLNHKQMVEWVAINWPDVFCDAAEATRAVEPEGVPAWILEIPNVYRPLDQPGARCLVSLIKHIRMWTGMGLREAMLVARALTGSLSADQSMDFNSATDWALECRKVLSTIRKAGILLA